MQRETGGLCIDDASCLHPRRIDVQDELGSGDKAGVIVGEKALIAAPQ
jgi:hypothetical protein